MRPLLILAIFGFPWGTPFPRGTLVYGAVFTSVGVIVSNRQTV